MNKKGSIETKPNFKENSKQPFQNAKLKDQTFKTKYLNLVQTFPNEGHG